MTGKSGRFILGLTFFSVSLFAVYSISQKFIPSSLNYDYTHVLIAYFFLLTATVHIILLKTGSSDEKSFIRAFMTTITMRFLLHMVIIFFWSFTHRETAVSFIITYFVLYLCYTLFEILVLMKIIKDKVKEKQKPLT